MRTLSMYVASRWWHGVLCVAIGTAIVAGGRITSFGESTSASATGQHGTGVPIGVAARPAVTIRGQVSTAATGVPAFRAQVTAISSGSGGDTKSTTTGIDGRYEIGGLPLGRYWVIASKPGYATVGFGQERSFEGGRPLDLTERPLIEEVNLVLERGGIVVGRVADSFGEPIVGAIVEVMRYRYMPSGQRQLVSGDTHSATVFTTNDLGEYRVFGLTPGSYIVSAREDSKARFGLWQERGISAASVGGVGHVRTYYPGTVSVEEAKLLTLSAGSESQATFGLVAGRSARVTGTVRDQQGNAVSHARVVLRSKDVFREEGGTYIGSQVSNGKFVLADVEPGRYTLEVRPIGGSAATGALTSGFASVPLAVNGDDIDNIRLTTVPGVTVSGRVRAEGRLPLERLGQLRMSATAEEVARNVLNSGSFDNGAVDEAGRFEIPGVFGRVVFRPLGLPRGWMLKSVTLKGVNITDRPIDSTSTGDVTNLEIVVSDRLATVTGFVKSADGESVIDCTVIVLPYRTEDGDVPIRFMHRTRPDQHGRFQIGRMPAGEYLIAAVTGVENGGEWDPAVRHRIEPFARRFHLLEGQSLAIEVPFIR